MSLVVDRRQETSSQGFSFHLRMNVDITRFNSLRVQLSMRDRTVCKESIPIRYKGMVDICMCFAKIKAGNSIME